MWKLAATSNILFGIEKRHQNPYVKETKLKMRNDGYYTKYIKTQSMRITHEIAEQIFECETSGKASK